MRSWFSCALCVVLVACGDDDGPPVDPDAAVFCRSDAECDDGIFCNGAESCAPGEAGANALGCRVADSPCGSDEVCDEAGDQCMPRCEVSEDLDGDGFVAVACGGDDCDDDDANTFPGNTEVCDDGDHDEDCDPDTVGDRDRDDDGFVDAQCCNPDPDGGDPHCGPDCADLDRGTHPLSSEVCDLRDNDCDGTTDEGVQVPGFLDMDGDLHGATDGAMMACAGSAHFSPVGDDCDDTDVTVHGAQVEFCDDKDNDCDEGIDEVQLAVTWYADVDGDGFGDISGDTVQSCEVVDGYSIVPLDCDDARAMVNPAAAEICDSLDNDCNGFADFQLGVNNFEDDDADGTQDILCGPARLDCDDQDPERSPLLDEICDLKDNDCDGVVDEDVTETEWFVDIDGDGYGVGTPVVTCDPPAGRAPRSGDCNDGNILVRPGIVETCNDVDDDCDGTVDEGAAADCRLPNAGAACVQGSCEVARCRPGFSDCNGIRTDGCEVGLCGDAGDCGVCGNVCSGACTAGGCEGGPPPEELFFSEFGSMLGGGVAPDGTRVTMLGTCRPQTATIQGGTLSRAEPFTVPGSEQGFTSFELGVVVADPAGAPAPLVAPTIVLIDTGFSAVRGGAIIPATVYTQLVNAAGGSLRSGTGVVALTGVFGSGLDAGLRVTLSSGGEGYVYGGGLPASFTPGNVAVGTTQAMFFVNVPPGPFQVILGGVPCTVDSTYDRVEPGRITSVAIQCPSAG